MRKIKNWLVITAIVAMAGCTHTEGNPFNRPSSALVVPDVTTVEQVLAAYGEPTRRKSWTISNAVVAKATPKSPMLPVPTSGLFTKLTYTYTESKAPAAGNTVRAKVLDLVFKNDILISYDFTSGFPEDSSNFDESKVSALKKVLTTRNDVIQLFGSPTGKSIYPAIANPGEEEYAYDYVAVNPSKHQFEIKKLQLLFNVRGNLVDFNFSSDTPHYTQGVFPVAQSSMLVVPYRHK